MRDMHINLAPLTVSQMLAVQDAANRKLSSMVVPNATAKDLGIAFADPIPEEDKLEGIHPSLKQAISNSLTIQPQPEVVIETFLRSALAANEVQIGNPHKNIHLELTSAVTLNDGTPPSTKAHIEWSSTNW